MWRWEAAVCGGGVATAQTGVFGGFSALLKPMQSDICSHLFSYYYNL